MSNYRLIKNTEWKEVEINGEEKEIPINWNVGILTDICEIKGGISAPKDFVQRNGEQTLPFFRVSNLSTRKKLLTEKDTKEFLHKVKYKSFPKDSILIAKSGESIRQKYRSFLAQDSVVVGHIAILLAKCDKDYLYNLLMYFSPEDTLLKDSTMPALSTNELCKFQIYYPSENEQSAIASILSEQESVIENIEQLIQKYESRFQYLSDELLSGRLRVKEVDGEMVLYKNPDDNWKEVEINGEMKEIPSDWENSTPKKLNFSIKTGKKDANAAKENGKYPFFTCSSNEILSIDTYVFDTEAILISGNGSTLGEVRYYKGKFDAYQRTYVIDNIKNIFYMNLYFKKYFRESLNIIGGSIPFIKLGDIENFNILIPKENEISLIVSILNQQDNLINEQKQIFKQEKQKFDWLLDNLLSGKYLIKENNET